MWGLLELSPPGAGGWGGGEPGGVLARPRRAESVPCIFKNITPLAAETRNRFPWAPGLAAAVRSRGGPSGIPFPWESVSGGFQFRSRFGTNLS